MKLRIETNIKLTDIGSSIECNFSKVKKLANKITLVINHVDMSVIKDRGEIESDYIYEVNYNQEDYRFTEITDKERIKRLENEVVELKTRIKNIMSSLEGKCIL